MEGLGKPPSAVEQLIGGYLSKLYNKTELSQLIGREEAAMTEMKAELYKDVFSPTYTETIPATEQSERNRQILLWAIDRGATIPVGLRRLAEYSHLSTSELLDKAFSPEQIHELQGALVYQAGKGNSDLDPKNTIVFGGILYSQARIGNEGDDILSSLTQKALAAPLSFSEPGFPPPFLQNDVRGAIHILPFGENKRVPGKELEAMMMLADDFLALINFWESSRVASYPRFILNTTNRSMSEVARKYLGAQVAEMGPFDNMILSTMEGLMGGTPPPEKKLYKVFMPEHTLKESKTRLEPLRERLFTLLREKYGGDLQMQDLLKKIRCDAIERISGSIKFLQIYKMASQNAHAAS